MRAGTGSVQTDRCLYALDIAQCILQYYHTAHLGISSQFDNL